MPKKTTKQVGNTGEDLAAKYLQSKQYEIIERNYRWARGEIDIVARMGEILVFVEVKTARGDRFGSPETWVNPRKQLHIAQAAQRYLQEKNIEEANCRFDVVAIQKQGGGWRIEHLENAFWIEG
jgi:putative endonuclease